MEGYAIHEDGDCSHCGGLGQVFGESGSINETCPYCNGTGKDNSQSRDSEQEENE